MQLAQVQLRGLAAPIWSAIERLRNQGAATGAALNAKFADEGEAFKGEMGFGGVEQFYGGARARQPACVAPAPRQPHAAPCGPADCCP